MYGNAANYCNYLHCSSVGLCDNEHMVMILDYRCFISSVYRLELPWKSLDLTSYDVIFHDNFPYQISQCFWCLQCAGLQPAPRGYAPSLDWQKQQVADFAEVRQVCVSLY